LDPAVEHALEVCGDTLAGEGRPDRVPVLRPARDHADVDGVALVAGAAVGEVVEQHAFHGHASSTSTRRPGSITVRSMSAGQYATISCTRGRPPAKPVTVGGPVRMSGASSRENASIGAFSCARTAIRSSTSGRSAGGGPASGP